eukprot:TRINITY_DN12554_c0_g2_i1.p1 TRINITY_DN12554_c0_g2~~TRINITY_DN12554_c0_g2_i1.p1  ORF type:complete len:535 (-),score=82.79 TRINITY_DN12554_c0_g2_i1:40-1644(-)
MTDDAGSVIARPSVFFWRRRWKAKRRYGLSRPVSLLLWVVWSSCMFLAMSAIVVPDSVFAEDVASVETGSALRWLARGGALQYVDNWLLTRLVHLKDLVATPWSPSPLPAKPAVDLSEGDVIVDNPSRTRVGQRTRLVPCEGESISVDDAVPHRRHVATVPQRGETVRHSPGLAQVLASGSLATVRGHGDGHGFVSDRGPISTPAPLKALANDVITEEGIKSDRVFNSSQLSAKATNNAEYSNDLSLDHSSKFDTMPVAAGMMSGATEPQASTTTTSPQVPPNGHEEERKHDNTDEVIMVLFLVQEIVALYVAWSAGEGIPQLTAESEQDPMRYRVWADRPLDCCENPALCISALFCPCVVFGQTAERIGCRPLDQFWKGFSAFCLVLLTAVLLGMFGIALVGALVYCLRTRVKEAYEFRVQSDNAQDYMLSCCCPTLAIAQEARHVESSRKAGFTFTPTLRWPERQRLALLTGNPIGVLNPPGTNARRPQWQGQFRGACGTIGSGGNKDNHAGAPHADASESSQGGTGHIHQQ